MQCRHRLSEYNYMKYKWQINKYAYNFLCDWLPYQCCQINRLTNGLKKCDNVMWSEIRIMTSLYDFLSIFCMLFIFCTQKIRRYKHHFFASLLLGILLPWKIFWWLSQVKSCQVSQKYCISLYYTLYLLKSSRIIIRVCSKHLTWPFF